MNRKEEEAINLSTLLKRNPGGFAKSIAASLAVVSALAAPCLFAEAAPCPPQMLDEAGNAISTPSCGSDGSQFADNEYGPLTRRTDYHAGYCPNVPTSFNSVTTVASKAEFQSAYRSAAPGDAIVIANGTYSWGDLLLDKNGTERNPIYIIAESLHDAVFTNLRMEITGSYNVVAGFKMDNNRLWPNFRVGVGGDFNRIACHWSTNKGVTLVASGNEANVGDDWEIDNNIINDIYGPRQTRGLQMNRCSDHESSCSTALYSERFHIHHNEFSGVASGDAIEAIQIGLGWKAWHVGYTSHDNGNMDFIVENNLFDGWNAEEELITVKASRNIIRYNCIKNAPGTYINFRHGDNNLYYGNWEQGIAKGLRISGSGNVAAFNYRSKPDEANSVSHMIFQLHAGRRHPQKDYEFTYLYRNTDNNVLQYNVSNKFRYWVRMRDDGGTLDHYPIGNIISNNHNYSDAFVQNFYGSGNEVAVMANNAFSSNMDQAGGALTDTDCFDESLFDGPGTEGVTKVRPGPGVQDLAPISPPSWWD